MDQETAFSLGKTGNYIGIDFRDTFGSRRSEVTRANLEILSPYPELLWVKSGEPWANPRHQRLDQGLDE